MKQRRITKSAPISFRLHRKDQDLFNSILDKDYLTASEVAREAVTEWLRHKTQEQPNYGTGKM
jgi:Arc/MetJ-type ribon-helix-helix transcriptional regulator